MTAVRLASGNTEYELVGPPGGSLVLLLHGGTVPMWTWDQQVPALVAAGFRVLRYDMLGKGRSACPDTVYNRALFQRQLNELLVALDITTPFHLVGFSFGAATAASFAAQHPHRVKQLALIAPVLHFAQGKPVVRAVRVPVLGRLFLHFVVMKKALERSSGLWRKAPASEHARYRRLFQEQIAQPGFERAFLSYLRSDALDDYVQTYSQVGQSRHEPLLIWGSKDDDVPLAHIQQLQQLMPRSTLHALQGVRHGAVFQASEHVNALLLAHLQQA